MRDSLEALRAGNYPLRQWRAPLYRSPRIAAEAGVRAAIHFILIAIIFVMAGWPTTALCLSLAAVIIGLSATAPDPRAFTTLAVFAMPIACLLAGILKYLVFNGVSEFQLLAIGLAPLVIGAALLITLPSGILPPLGRLSLVFTLVILAPSNPQSYDPRRIPCDVSVCPAFLGSGLRGATPAAVLVRRTEDPAAAGRGPSRAEPPRFRSEPGISRRRKPRFAMPPGSSRS